jgi:sulfite reductase (ferredoxin)
LNIEQLHVLATIGNSLGEDSIRLAPTQNVVLRHVPADQLSELHAQLVRAFRGVARPRVLGDLTCCAGAATCQLGICRPPGLADALEQRLARLSERELERVRGLSIRLSGCPNNCGRHVLADLGLQGKAIRHGAAHMPGYRIMVGARREEPAHLARPLGDLPVRRVPDFVAEILRRFAGSEHARFEEFVTEHEGDLRNLLAGVNSAYPLTSDDASDLGATEAFSLPETTAGECSA